MSITDELREYVGLGDGTVQCALRAIADRIDKEHAEAVADALQLRGGPDRWVELPVDADGVPICVGDNVAEGDDEFEVRALSLYDKDTWDVLDRLGVSFLPTNLHHVQPDSWERIIQDAVKLGYADYPTTGYEAELVERCKRLAGE